MVLPPLVLCPDGHVDFLHLQDCERKARDIGPQGHATGLLKQQNIPFQFSEKSFTNSGISIFLDIREMMPLMLDKFPIYWTTRQYDYAIFLAV